MKVEQIAIFLENKFGRLAEITSVLAENGINIRAMSLADTTDFGILRLIVNDTEKAIKVLKENAFTANKTDVVVVEVTDTPGELANVLNIIKNAKINIEYMYAFSQKNGKRGLIIFRFDELDAAIETLTGAGIKILPGSEVYAI